LLHDADFAALRPRPDFQLLLMDLGFPAEPFTGDDRAAGARVVG
jgi:hypothetical protein